MPLPLRAIPKVDRLLASEDFAPLLARHPRAAVVAGLREVLGRVRAEVLGGSEPEVAAAALAGRVEERLAERALPSYRRVINATGIVLHTGLGRAALAEEAVAALTATASHAQRLEIELESGERGGRDAGCAGLLRELTGCEDAIVVNNNAGATLLILAALARGRQVVLSRGEMVEIGGSYRIPDVMEESGARLVEVGTTNRTHLEDYRRALGPETGMILKVHPSNYRIEGFTAEVEIEALVALGREHGIPVVHDVGSGCLLDLARFGLPGETLLRRPVAAGVDLVCCSGDKLLGGPQAGLLFGRREAVERCRRHPLYRALRPGRLIYTALEATLRLYRAGDETALAHIPALRKLLEPEEVLRRRARRLLRRLTGVPGLEASLVPCRSQAGSGSLPARDLPGWGVRLRSTEIAVTDLAAGLRTGEPAVLGRIQEEGLILDVRTIEEAEVVEIAGRVRGVLSPHPRPLSRERERGAG
jgi:L-seryl-tRNA(Ser) seleniumtransferase